MMPETIHALLEHARMMQQRAFAPYSNFKVGACVQTSCGKLFGGCNIESASYGLTICAERVAIFNAIAQGYNSFTHLALVTTTGAYPCGACRQIIYEFCPNASIIIATASSINYATSKELLPHAFNNEKLGR